MKFQLKKSYKELILNFEYYDLPIWAMDVSINW